MHELLYVHEDGAPFTMQRLCELLLEPQKQYSRFDKLVNAHAHLSQGCTLL